MREKFKEYFYQHFISVTSFAMIVFGGVIFLSYYFSIGYMPDLDFSSSLHLLAVTSIVALVVFFVLSILIIFPGIIWKGVCKSDMNITFKNKFIDKQKGLNPLAEVFFITAIVFHSFLISSIYLYFKDYSHVGWFPILVALPVMVLLIRSKVKNLSFEGYVGIVYGAFLTSVVSIIVFFLLKENIEPYGDSFIVVLLSLIGINVVIIFLNVFSTFEILNIKVYIAMFSLFLLLIPFGYWEKISNKIMSQFKFGNIVTTQIFFKPQACNVIKLLDIQVDEAKSCRVENVKILSRLGKQLYLQVDQNNGELKFTIPSSQILSWVVKERKENTD